MDFDFKDGPEGTIDFSESQLREAYGRMEMDRQPWASHTGKEVDFIESVVDLRGSNVLDMGCGIGRHSLEIASRHPQSSVLGIDFSESNISKIGKKPHPRNARFQVADGRGYRTQGFDVALALYDVIGSFPDEEDNLSILRNCVRSLSPGGTLIISVMNMELTRAIARPENVGNVIGNPELLFRLKPTDIMHKCGDVFDPEHFLIDPDSNLVYRKEQFSGDDSLQAEYVIRDRRYTGSEVREMLESEGMTVSDIRYVQAGRWDTPLEPTDPKAKEILAVAVKR